MPPKHWRPAALAVSIARGPIIVLSLVATAIVSALFGIWLSLVDATTMQVFESQMAFTTQRFIDALGPLGPDGISEVIRVTITLDFVYPIAYATAVGAVWARLSGPSGWRGRALPLVAAIGAAAADWLENLLHLAAMVEMAGGSRPSVALVATGSVLATLKWGFLLYALVMTARAAVQRKGRAALTAIPLALLAGGLAGMVLAATL
jgi:hypothetical protein